MPFSLCKERGKICCTLAENLHVVPCQLLIHSVMLAFTMPYQVAMELAQ